MLSSAHLHVRCTPVGRASRWVDEIKCTPRRAKTGRSATRTATPPAALARPGAHVTTDVTTAVAAAVAAAVARAVSAVTAVHVEKAVCDDGAEGGGHGAQGAEHTVPGTRSTVRKQSMG